MLEAKVTNIMGDVVEIWEDVLSVETHAGKNVISIIIRISPDYERHYNAGYYNVKITETH